MSDLKSAWELSLEKSEKLVPELKKQKKLSARQKEEIKQIRQEYKAKIADKEITVQTKIDKLADQVAPEVIAFKAEELKQELAEKKKSLDEEMEREIEAVRSRSA